LSTQTDKPKNYEGYIRLEAVKNIELVMNFSAANHIENLHQHKRVKDECKVAGSTVLHCHFCSV